MTNYKRFISYLYCYEAGKKMGNVGYARVETSDDISKVTLHCTTKVLPQKECKVYLIRRSKASNVSKQVGKITAQNGFLDLKLVFEERNTEEADFSVKESQGVVLMFSKDNYIAAKWDNSNFSYHEAMNLEQSEELSDVALKETTDSSVLNLTEETYKKEQVKAANIGVAQARKEELEHNIYIVESSSIINLSKDSEKKDVFEESVKEVTRHDNMIEINKAKERIKQVDQEMAKVIEKEVSYEVENQRNEKAENENNKEINFEGWKADLTREDPQEKNEVIEDTNHGKGEEADVLLEETFFDDIDCKEEESLQEANNTVPNPNLWADHPSARAILNRFVRMYPFDDSEIAECVRLEPKDIGLLPMSAWVLGNNSFLLHSYCNFRHLLFAKKLTREGCVYLLMVPGAYNKREQQLAKMFGFQDFKCSRRRSMRDGEFGYWFVTITFE